MNNHKLALKNACYVFISLVLSLSVYLSLSSLLSTRSVSAQSVPANTLNSTTTDAIAVRIVANPSQYIIEDWYAMQGFAGSPQKIKVDGYDAIRDNRTVYVAATNIKGTCNYSLPGSGASTALPATSTSRNIFQKIFQVDSASAATECSINSDCGSGTCVLSKIYFNIYIITYNQGAGSNTTDVFGKILASWKFNNNLNGQLGTCSFPPKNCQAVSDCGSAEDYDCNPNNSRCVSKHKCLSDADCSGGALCNSAKSSILRDIKRLQSLNKINSALKSYKNAHSKYPILASGTFLPQAVVSTWPSWQSAFAAQIGSVSNDPINKLGVCNTSPTATTTMDGFDGSTCWNGTTKRYYNGSNSSNLELPAGSYAMVYTTNANGSNYKLCANMETSYNFMSVDGIQTNLAAANCHTTASAGYSGAVNNPPTIVAMNLNGIAGEEFNGYIKAQDPNGNPITFSILDNVSEPANYWGSWENGIRPVLKATTDPQQKKVWSAKAGAAGNYNITIRITDSLGAGFTTTTAIKISAGAPVVTASDADYDLSQDPNSSLNYNLYFDDSNFTYLTLNYNTSLASALKNWLKNLSTLIIAPAIAQIQLSPASRDVPIIIGQPITLNCASVTQPGGGWRVNRTLVNCFNLNNGLKGKLYTEANGRFRLNIYGTISGLSIPQDTNLNYKIKVFNSLNKNTEKSFAIKLKANPPQLDFSCNKKAGLYQNYSCQINNLNTKNKTTTYVYSHLNLDSPTASSDNFLNDLPAGFVGSPSTGLISGMPVNIGNYRFKIQAYNEYGAYTEKYYDLKVESSCGKELVQYAGGPWDQRGEVRNQGGYYKTVLIDGKCWLGDNLNVDSSQSIFQHYQNNIVNQAVKKSNWLKETLSLLFQPYVAFAQTLNINPAMLMINQIGVCYNGDNTYCEADGRLYKASEAMAGSNASSTRGICPNGYHIPSNEEYTELVNYLGTDAGNKLKQNGDSGFEGLLVGSATKSGTTTTFMDRNTNGNFWSSTVQGVGNFFYQLFEGSPLFTRPNSPAGTDKYYSLRCVQNKQCPSSCTTCNNVGACCNASSWTPAVNARCGNFTQTSNCGTTQMATGTLACVVPQTCGGGGTPNVCGCTPNCANKVCGSNGCGGTCGTCAAGSTCSSNGMFCVTNIGGGGTVHTGTNLNLELNPNVNANTNTNLSQ